MNHLIPQHKRRIHPLARVVCLFTLGLLTAGCGQQDIAPGPARGAFIISLSYGDWINNDAIDSVEVLLDPLIAYNRPKAAAYFTHNGVRFQVRVMNTDGDDDTEIRISFAANPFTGRYYEISLEAPQDDMVGIPFTVTGQLYDSGKNLLAEGRVNQDTSGKAISFGANQTRRIILLLR